MQNYRTTNITKTNYLRLCRMGCDTNFCRECSICCRNVYDEYFTNVTFIQTAARFNVL